jgi:hypothetical protein
MHPKRPIGAVLSMAIWSVRPTLAIENKASIVPSHGHVRSLVGIDTTDRDHATSDRTASLLPGPLAAEVVDS